MRKIGNTFFILWFGLLTLPALHAEPHIAARVSANEISLNDTTVLSIEISGVGNINAAPVPQISGFQVQPAGQTQSFQWINGQSSSLIGYNYVLTPLQAGSFTIPAITLTHDGKNYATEPITVVVKDAPTPSVGNTTPSSKNVGVPTEGLKPIFVTAHIDSSKAYVGEQILLTIQFLRRAGVRITSQPRYSEPDMTGFLVEPLKQQEYQSNLHGIPYDVTELRYALFPTSDGEFAIGSATIELAVQSQTDPFDPNSFFQNFFGRSQVMKLTTRAIPVQVRALPKNKPGNFTGAVGRYKVSSRIDLEGKEPEVGKPINLIVAIEGVGNIKTLKEPALAEVSGIRRYETISSMKINNEGKFINGKKEFKFLLIPQVSGQITIPSINYSFFNPDQNTYQTESTRDIQLTVKPGALTGNDESYSPRFPADKNGLARTEGVRVVEKDIRFLKMGGIKSLQSPLYLRPSFYLLNAVPLLFSMGALLTRWRVKQRTLHAGHFRSRGALKNALKKLKNLQDYSQLSSALTGFLADKLGLSAHGLRWDEINASLNAKGVDEPLRLQLKELLDETDMVRFAASEFTSEMKLASVEKTKLLLKTLDRRLS